MFFNKALLTYAHSDLLRGALGVLDALVVKRTALSHRLPPLTSGILLVEVLLKQ